MEIQRQAESAVYEFASLRIENVEFIATLPKHATENNVTKSYIMNVEGISFMDQTSGQPIPVMLWHADEVVRSSFSFMSKPDKFHSKISGNRYEEILHQRNDHAT
eukprot:UN20682